jgi:hypothetical protein
MDIKALVKKWEAVLNEGQKISNPKILKSTAVMLENEHKYLLESGSTMQTSLDRSGSYSTNGDFYQIAVPMVRRTFPELVAHDLVGVQPLSGPVGLAFALRFRAGQTYDSVAHGNELGYNTVDKDYSLTTPSSAAEALGSKAGSGVGNDIGLGVGTGTQISEVNMTVEKAQVEAKTRKLRSRWSLEVAQDLQAMHGLNLEDEMMDILSYEITQEIDRELIYEIRTAAKTSPSSGGWDYLVADGRWEAEKYRNLYNQLIRKANDIAISTRRGAGNWVVCHPTVCAAFEATSAFTIAPVANDINTALTGVAKVGALDGRITVYRDTFDTVVDYVVGFKGASEYDTGIIYLPYIALMANRAVFENSFNPTIGLMSRYAIHSNIFGSKLYYRYVKVDNFVE